MPEDDSQKQVTRLLEKLEKLSEMEDGVTKEEFQRAVELILQIVERNVQAVDTLERTYEQLLSQTRSDAQKTLQDLKGQVDSVFVEERVRTLEQRIDTKLQRVRDGRDGADGKSIQGPRGPSGAPGRTPTVAEMRAALKPLIEEAKEELRRSAPTQRVGGYTDGHVKQAMGRVVQKETPSGAIDGNNTTYTTNHAIHAVLSFVINGQSISDDEYTVSGNTITMSDPLPSALSGTSYRIVYV